MHPAFPSPSRQAATVVLVRDVSDGPPELLVMQRAGSMAFAANALVFPGGAVDADDVVLAQSTNGGLPLDEAAARIAAIRETLEECGLGVGFPADMVVPLLHDMRRELAQGVPFSALIARHAIMLDLDRLIPFARWHPAAIERVTRLYDTRFYLARAPEGGQQAQVDATENIHLFWDGAQSIIDRCDAGQGRIIYPTRRNLERLAQFDNFDAIADHASAIPVEKVTPWIEEREDGGYLCIPTHLGYPVTSEPVGRADRH